MREKRSEAAFLSHQTLRIFRNLHKRACLQGFRSHFNSRKKLLQMAANVKFKEHLPPLNDPTWVLG
jgi:hypothetical protein